MHWLRALLYQEYLTLVRAGRDIALMLGFSLIALSLMAITAEPAWRAMAAPGMIWIIVLFSVLLMIDRIFQDDHRSGRLEALLAQPIPKWIIILAKAIGFWLRTALPIIMTAPIAVILLQMPIHSISHLLIGLTIGTPSLCLFATVGAALGLGARQPTLLVMVLVLPLLIPILLFGSLGLHYSLTGNPVIGHYLWLGVCLCLSIICIPLGALALKPANEPTS